MFVTETNTSALVAEGGASVIAVTFFSHTLTLMYPFLFVSLTLIIADLYFGVGAAKIRYANGEGEPVRVSKAIRRTVNKIFEYACWVILSASLAVAFDLPALNWIILAIVIGNEIISIFSNWMYLHGKKVTGLQEALFSWLGNKFDADTSSVKVEPVKPKRTKKTQA